MIQWHGFKGAKDARNVESDIQLLFEAIGLAIDADGWTEEVDLFDLFIRMSLDMSLKHLFGQTAGSQLTGFRERRGDAAMSNYQVDAAEGAETSGKAMNYIEGHSN